MQKKSRIKKITACALFAALMVVGAYIRIPLQPVPVTLQLFFVLLCGMVLDARSAALSMAVYTALGLAGLPVFSGGGGIGYVVMPTFGYILGFIAAAAIIALCLGAWEKKKGGAGYGARMIFGIVGLFVIYGFGIGYCALLQGAASAAAVAGTAVYTLPVDLVMCGLAAWLSGRLRRAVR